jgi:hypothetical protein
LHALRNWVWNFVKQEKVLSKMWVGSLSALFGKPTVVVLVWPSKIQNLWLVRYYDGQLFTSVKSRRSNSSLDRKDWGHEHSDWRSWQLEDVVIRGLWNWKIGIGRKTLAENKLQATSSRWVHLNDTRYLRPKCSKECVTWKNVWIRNRS